MRRGSREPRRPDGLPRAGPGASAPAHHSILRETPAQDEEAFGLPEVQTHSPSHGAGGTSHQ